MPTHRTPKRTRKTRMANALNQTFDETETHDESATNAGPSNIDGNGYERDSLLHIAPSGSNIPDDFERRLEGLRLDMQRQIMEMQHTILTQIRMVSVQNEQSRSPNDQTPETNSVQIPHTPNVDTAPIQSNGTIPKPKKIYPLPEFHGSPEEWTIFIEDFKSTTREFGYSDLQNTMRLRDSLKGKARGTVEALLSNSANVNAIIEMLEETFGRPEQLIKSQIANVRKIVPVAEGDMNALVIFANKVINMTTFLKNANGEHHLSNPTLLSELVNKLPFNRKVQWAEKCLALNGPITVIDFSNWLSALRKVANMVIDTLPVEETSTQRPSAFKKCNHAIVQKQVCRFCQGSCKNLEECNIFKNSSIQERIDAVKQLRLCFCCLKGGHRVSKCFKKALCGHCGEKHHNLLHLNNLPENQENRNCHVDGCNSAVVFQVVPVTLYANNHKVTTYAFVDDGANATIIDKELATSLGIKGKKDFLDIQWLNRQTSREECENIDIEISGTYVGAEVYKISNVYTSSNLSLPIQSLENTSVELSHLKHIPYAPYSTVKPRIIISLAHAYLTTPLKTPVTTTESGLIAIKTRLGWIVYGPRNNTVNVGKKYCLMVNKIESIDEEVKHMMDEYFNMETFGVKVESVESNICLAEKDQKAISFLKKSIRRISGRFECGLIWKEEFSAFPNSYCMAYKRLLSTERKMKNDTEFAERYRQKIEEYIQKGYIRKLGKSEVDVVTPKTFYLPHFGVINPNKPGIRIVFDAAAKVNGTSFNDALLTGPDLTKPLLEILMKFREAEIAVVGDIKEMFLQIQIPKNDEHSQRFLWRNGNTSKPIDTYVMQRVMFGATCSPTIAQFVKNFNAESFREQYPRAAEGILNRHYVDDYVDSFQNEELAVEVVGNVIRIHKEGGFELKKIQSNSAKIMRLYGNGEYTENVNVDKKDNRILGMYWSVKSDTFTFVLKLNKVNPEILNCRKRPTKRELLCLTMSIFDPFGFLADFMITAKLLMQRVWKSGVKWDDEITDGLYSYWKKWIQELSKIQDFRINRCYSPTFLDDVIDLHIFVDASEDALAAVAYWRSQSKNVVKVIFVMGKTSCSPSRYHTIPKLELQAAVMGVRLKNKIISAHTITVRRVFFWSDSNAVLMWLRSDHRRYKQYVANRVSEILESSEVEQWRWIAGKENPADEGTRFKNCINYKADSKWKNGPEFLYLEENLWPKQTFQPDNKMIAEELRMKYVCVVHSCIPSILPEIGRFSNYIRLRRTVAYVLRYISNLKQKIKMEKLIHGELTAEEEIQAEEYIIRCSQKEMFPEDYIELENGRPVSKESNLRTLNPYIEEGVVRANGRLDNAIALPMSVRRPIILAKTHELTMLIVRYYHQKFHHINRSTVISEIRQKFWVISIRDALKRVESRCQFCRNRRSQPVQPQMAPLPTDRVTPYVRPFSYCGVDLFGPCFISIRRSQEKRWVVIFTCLTVRAIHLEIITSTSTDSFLLALRNFMNRRGVPVQFRSDNGSNFVGINKELHGDSTFIDFDSVTSKLAPLGIKWIFNTPMNPSEGGAWERLVQSVKKVLANVVKEKAPQLETFRSLLIEAENIVNSRPLTHLPISINEPEPLTPNHFLLGCNNSTQTPSNFEKKDLCLRKQWKILRSLKNCWWRRWIREYLPDLIRRAKWCSSKNTVNVGSIVYIVDVDMSRSNWKLGRIVQLFYGKDGIVRSAEVRTTSGLLKRPLSKLAILDTE